MDRQDLFDALTVRFSDVVERRMVLRTLGKLILAMVAFGVFPWRVMAQDVAPESQLVQGCKLPGQKCSGKKDCCSQVCLHHGDRCGCVSKGKTPIVDTPLGPVPVRALCCTNKINKRRGTCR